MLSLPLLLAAAASLQAIEIKRIPAADAEQGVASDGRHLYAISNHAIAEIDPATGKEVRRWDGDAEQFPHINSCTIDRTILVCAASNFPGVPMTSMIERFDARTLRHISTQPLGHAYGSLTWVVPHGGDWWACFANYDGHGGEPGRDHRYTLLVRYDRDWQEKGQWHFPPEVLARMAPRSASGGAWGDDGLLYVTGHDRPELYALRVPSDGGVLQLAATITIPTDGQAIDWDRAAPRLLWSIERKTQQLVASRIPPVPAN
jgi:outer membrane protein assembly factor BamB